MSIVLNGSTQYAYILEALATGRPLTIAGWVKSDSNSAYQTVAGLANKNSDTDYRILGLAGGWTGDPVIAMERSSSANEQAKTITGYSVGTWHHTLAEFNTTTLRKALIDEGSEGQNFNFVNPVGLDKTAVGVICRSSSAWFFDGKLAEVAMWNAILTPQQKSDLAGGADPSTIQSENLLAYWPLYGDANDDSGNAKHLTEVGSPTYDTEDHPEMGPTELAGSLSVQSNLPSVKLTRYNTQLIVSLSAETTTLGVLSRDNAQLNIIASAQSNLPSVKLTRYNTQLIASSFAESSITGGIEKYKKLAGSLSAQSNLPSVKLTRYNTQLIASSSAESSIICSLLRNVMYLKGDLSAQSNIIVEITKRSGLAGISTSIASTTVNIKIIVGLVGSSISAASIIAHLIKVQDLIGLSISIASITAKLIITPIFLTGFVTSASTIEANLVGIQELIGALTGECGVAPGTEGNLTIVQKLIGDLFASCSTEAILFVELTAKILFWKPEGKIKEILDWKTDILRSHIGKEQRIKLRQIPRQFFKLQFVLDTDKINSWFDSILHTWQKRAWKIPIWTENTIHTEDINAGDMTIYFDTRFADYRTNSYAIIWKSSSEYEFILINTKTTSQLNLKFHVRHTFTGAKYITPCRIAYMVSTNTKQKYNSPVSITEAVFIIYNNININGHSSEVEYDNLEVLIIPSYMDDTHNEESDGQIEINDFQTGIFKVRSNKEYNLLAQNHIFYNDTKEACWKFRQFLHWLNGRQKAVLIPTFRNDLNQIGTIEAGNTFFYIENIKLAFNMKLNELRTYIGFLFPDGTKLIRKIINIEEIDSIKEKININTALGQEVEPEDCKICFVDKCRLTSDRVEINWPFTHKNECRINLTRVP